MHCTFCSSAPRLAWALQVGQGHQCLVRCRLENLGSSASVGQELMDKQLATPGSGKVGEILSATTYQRDGVTQYLLEYKLRKDEGTRPWRRHFLAVLCARNEQLYTLTTQCTEARWPELESAFRKAAGSFVVASIVPAAAPRRQRNV